MNDANNIYIAAETFSNDVPLTPGAYDGTQNGGSDIWLIQLGFNGSLAYSSYLGGSGDDQDACIALSPDNKVYVVGETESTNFPTTAGAYDRTFEAQKDLTVTVMDFKGQGIQDLVYSSYIGGLCNDQNGSLVVGDDGAAYVVAQTGLPASFPTTPGAFDSTHNGETDLVVFKLMPNGQGAQDLKYSTYFGGSGIDGRFGRSQGIAMSRQGYLVFAGESDSQNVPIPLSPNAYDKTFNGEFDLFVAALRLDGQGPNDLVFSTYFGGSGSDWAAGVAVDDAGLVYFSGESDSQNVPIPLVNPIQPGFGGGWDAVAGVLSPDASELLFSTYLGGSSAEINPAMSTDNKGNMTIAGDTESFNFPTKGAVQATRGGGEWDVFATRIDQIGVRTVTISNATNERPELAPETIVSGFGTGLAGQTLTASALPLPTNLDGVTVKVIDSLGASRLAGLFFVSEFQINYLVPQGTALGWARVEICRDDIVVSRDGINVTAISPGLYTANGTGSGPPAAQFLLVRGDGSRESDFVFDAGQPLGQRTPVPLDLGNEGDELYIILYVTGSRGASTVTATVGNLANETATPATTPFVLGAFAGLEQVNIGPIPRSLIGTGLSNIKVYFDGQLANIVQVILQ